ncbi:Spore coat protein U (SCPU) domain-containing protein [Pseudomonas citronellolis]|uniref:Spore coat protein U (SCPU) domain-containing protein n=1 Tax=Pseudomonas citronellolis TaxID=53408 RepID=A0AAQ1HIN8_9PSED|nr:MULTISPECIES: spore coat U domain-containing protein [Pseudomonas]MCL6688101.1 spore coat U domain-containing protein [Pseudomonas sp. R3.Fl]MCP1603690.1 spore coat protein U-like protein [Pseudomonas citronellolis]MCP1643835.1 spore coat protein U-like protein [Pseudomonas citronellolis]MCP1653243.1 spore coat protein U-like protein [Pseudomonas citronellolis]MCP1666760.1 spore coat protein U-like protein [Pseudomonas citronellolis]
MTHNLLKHIFAGTLLALPLEQALALAEVYGDVEVYLEISKGCQVGGSAVLDSTNDFGELDFGRVGPTWDTTLKTQLISPQGGTLQVTCDPNIKAFKVAIDGGRRGDRMLKLNTGPDTVAYKVYQDAQHTKEYAVDQFVSFPIPTGGATVNIPIHGSIAPNTRPKPSGTYQDTLTVTIDF